MCADPKSVKNNGNLTVFFMLLGSTSVKAARKTLVKLTPDHQQNEINCVQRKTKNKKIVRYIFNQQTYQEK